MIPSQTYSNADLTTIYMTAEYMPTSPEDAELITELGDYQMQPARCFENAYHGAKQKKGLKPVMGFAIDKGAWKPHAWLVDTRKGKIYETTPIIRDGYYGAAFPPERLGQYVE